MCAGRRCRWMLRLRGRADWAIYTLIVKDGQVELAEPFRVVEDVDLGDLPAADREGHDREQLRIEHADQPRHAVDERRASEQAEAREALRATSHLLRTAKLERCACDRTAVRAQHHLRVEDSDEPVEVTILRGCDKGVDHVSLNLTVASGVALRA
jgi:hypothetical protein